MPRNKEALIRYRVINRCLKDRKYVSKQEMKEACESVLGIYPIGERTIDADIHAMRYDDRLGYHAPIGMDRFHRAYYYEDPGYSIDNMPLNEEELDSIVFASKLLEQFKEAEIFNRFTGSVQKLVEAVNMSRHNDKNTIADYIDFEKVDEVKGIEFIDPLIEVLKNKEVIKIEYRSFWSDKDTTHIVHPYLLKEYRNRWYLVGYHNYFKDIRTYGLDRIIAIENEYIDFLDTGFDAKEYYKHVIGITVLDEEPIEIELSLTKEQAQYIISQPIHESQELISETENEIVFRLKLVPNYEFISLIRGWGEMVKVLKPKNFG